MENKMYLVVNGDNISEQLSDTIVNDDVQGFEQTSNKFNQARQSIDAMVEQAGGRVVVSNADEAVYELPDSDYSDLANQIMQSYKEAAGTSITIGSGSTLSQAYKALSDGKDAGKDQYMPFSDQDQGEEDTDFSGDVSEEEVPEDQDMDMQDGDEQLVPDNSTEEDQNEEMDGINQESNTDSQEEFGDDFSDDQTGDSGDSEFAPNDFAEQDGSEDQADMEGQDQVESEDSFGTDDESQFGEDDESDFTDVDEDGEHEDIHSLLASHMAEGDEGEEGDVQEDNMSDDQMSDDDIPFLQDHEVHQGEESEMGTEQDPMQEDPMADQQQMDGDSQAPESDEQLKQRIMMSLQQFKENKGAIEQARQSDPAAYESMINMLQAMIAMAKQLGVSVDESAQPQQDDQGQMSAPPQGQPVPKM